MSWIAAGVIGGAALMGGGTALSANAASKSKDALRKVAKTPFTDYKGIQFDTIGGNLSALPKASELATGINKANQAERQRMIETGMPEFDSIRGAANRNLESWLAGELPDDVAEQVQRNTAARALAGGYGGSGMHGNLTARDLGLTSMDLIGRGMSYAPGFLSTMSNLLIPEQFNLSSMLLNPAGTVDLRSRERAQNMNAAMGAASAPGATQAWGSGLQQIGGALLGGSITGGLGGLGGGNSGNMAKQFGAGSEMDLMQRYGG